VVEEVEVDTRVDMAVEEASAVGEAGSGDSEEAVPAVAAPAGDGN
jgi:hypothetical protein